MTYFKKITIFATLAIFIGYAPSVSAEWQGTSWIQDGAIISSQKTEANLQYLYSRITELEDAISQCSCSIPEAPVTECSDGIDNDGNSLADMDDKCACDSPSDNDESFSIVACPVNLGTVICTELHRQGLLKDEWLEADAQFGERMPDVVMRGYHLWAKPVVKVMQSSEKVTKIVNFVVQPWAQEMAHIQGVEEKGSFVGKLLMVIGIPVSAVLGVFGYIIDFIQF